ncbi:MAG: Rpn family recombination-promoting nuclease/putative transposase [Lachnospiraceae bacterium]|nr:Rpn family recombination-promoting nuclease/putative transposase [Lachnospiraceae bacterium]
MNNNQQNTFQNATGKIDYTLMNDYMFRAVMQESKNVLKEFICALLHLNPKTVKSVTILNPLELGKSFNAKTFVLDIKVLLDNATIINLEMQVLKQSFWIDRSLSYLCDIFNNLEKGNDYSQIKPAYHIGIVDFTPFPDYPEFYATNKLMNVKKHYIYNDNFTLNVLDLSYISHSKLCNM